MDYGGILDLLSHTGKPGSDSEATTGHGRLHGGRFGTVSSMGKEKAETVSGGRM